MRSISYCYSFIAKPKEMEILMEYQNYITSINTNQPITTRKYFKHLSKTGSPNIGLVTFFIQQRTPNKNHAPLTSFTNQYFDIC